MVRPWKLFMSVTILCRSAVLVRCVLARGLYGALVGLRAPSCRKKTFFRPSLAEASASLAQGYGEVEVRAVLELAQLLETAAAQT